MDRINLNKLYYFYVVAKTGSVKAAIKKLHLSQSTVSGQIRELEDDLGYDLFIREHRKLVLSPRGEVVLQKAEQIFNLAEGLREVSSPIRAAKHINIGVLPSLASLFVYDFSVKLWKDPKYRIATYSGTIPQLIHLLDRNEIDLILTDGPVSFGKRYKNIKLDSDPLVAVTRNKKAILGSKFPQNLAGNDYIKIAQPSTLQSDIDYFLKLQNIFPKVVGEVHDMNMAKSILMQRDGFTILPKQSVQSDLKQKKLVSLGQFNSPLLNLTAVLPSISDHQKIVRNLIRDYFQRKAKR